MDIFFLYYKLDIVTDSEGGITPNSDTLVVEDPEDISESITGMYKLLFVHVRIQKEGIYGHIFTFFILNP